MKVGIIGIGIVGGAIRHGFEKLGHDVKIHDTKYTTIYNKTTINDVLDTDVCFVCVPTVSLSDGKCDVSIVKQVVGQLADMSFKGIVAIKSTVEPGTTFEFLSISLTQSPPIYSKKLPAKSLANLSP